MLSVEGHGPEVEVAYLIRTRPPGPRLCDRGLPECFGLGPRRAGPPAGRGARLPGERRLEASDGEGRHAGRRHRRGLRPHDDEAPLGLIPRSANLVGRIHKLMQVVVPFVNCIGVRRNPRRGMSVKAAVFAMPTWIAPMAMANGGWSPATAFLRPSASRRGACGGATSRGCRRVGRARGCRRQAPTTSGRPAR